MHVVYSHMLYVTFCCLTGFWLCISLCHIYFVFKFSWIQELTNFVMWWLDWFMTLSSQLHQRHQCSLSIASIMLNTSNEIKKLMATKDWQSCCWSRGFFLLLAYSFVCVQCVCDMCVPYTGSILIGLKGVGGQGPAGVTGVLGHCLPHFSRCWWVRHPRESSWEYWLTVQLLQAAPRVAGVSCCDSFLVSHLPPPSI